jgi:hypothetical protein
MSLDHLPANLEKDVQIIANELHIPRDEALLKVIESGITEIRPQTKGTLKQENDILANAMKIRRIRNAARQAAREALALSRPETPDALIGFLADAPEVAENIRRLAYERRSQAFGDL